MDVQDILPPDRRLVLRTPRLRRSPPWRTERNGRQGKENERVVSLKLERRKQRRGRAPYRACARRRSLRPGLANWHFLFLASKYRITSGTSVGARRSGPFSFGFPPGTPFPRKVRPSISLHPRPLCLPVPPSPLPRLVLPTSFIRNR